MAAKADAKEAYSCPVCYDPAQRTKLWGGCGNTPTSYRTTVIRCGMRAADAGIQSCLAPVVLRAKLRRTLAVACMLS